MTFSTYAEQQAECAENLNCFQGIKLLHIRNQIKEVLSLIGRGNIFDEYTIHSIDHIDEMLKITQWLIPEQTSRKMTKADWLMLVLSFYFHDLGMLVTKDEFKNKNSSQGYCEFINRVNTKPEYSEFKEKVEYLSENKENFLFQEYVRTVHASRIKSWIEGNISIDNDLCTPIIQEIDALLCKLPPKFRRDLAVLCESHHLEDLDDFSKYKTVEKYGNNQDEWVNLHYIAIILRTADLLHITSNRAPSIQYGLINPSDPKSIIEWKKQSAVNAVQPKASVNADGIVNKSAPRDTIEITAYFDNSEHADAYFGLQSYIEYARKEIKLNYEHVQKAIKIQDASDYEFPWNKIDDNGIEAYGFETHKLQFTLDQENILNLLVGNTLYNDKSVVIRELAQNAIDAIKLQNLIETRDSMDKTDGSVLLSWDSSQRILTCTDNGTGMSCDDITDFLFRVGASKYRSSSFLKEFPDFKAISRFGIGILTCFMIAEDIDIITNSTKEDTCNKLSIRKVSGKYLLKKDSKAILDNHIRPHGTKISLRVRRDVDMSNIREIARHWFVAPSIPVYLAVDAEESERIGFATIKEALSSYFEIGNIPIDNKQYSVIAESSDGVDMVYAVAFNKHYNTWRFVRDNDIYLPNIKHPIGTCIDGIRVEFSTPGFRFGYIFAIANVIDTDKFQTNVARSAIEASSGKRSLLRSIYTIYANHIQRQISKLKDSGSSLTSLAHEAQFLVDPFYSSSELPPLNSENEENYLFQSSLDDIRCICIEYKEQKREMVSPRAIQNLESVNIVDSSLLRSINILLLDSSTTRTASDIAQYVSGDLGLSRTVPTIYNFSNANQFHRSSLKGKSVSEIEVMKEQKQMKLTFSNCDIWDEYHLLVSDSHRDKKYFSKLFLPKAKFSIIGMDSNECGIISLAGIYLDSNGDLYKSIAEHLLSFQNVDKNPPDGVIRFFLTLVIRALFTENSDDFLGIAKDVYARNATYLRRESSVTNLRESIWSVIDQAKFEECYIAKGNVLYDPLRWSRSPNLNFL